MSTSAPASIRTLITKFNRFVWQEDLRSLPKWKATTVGLLQIFGAVIRDLRDGQLGLRAMSLVYTTLLALVPLLAVAFSVLKAFGVHNRLEPVLLGLLEPLGENSAEIAERIVGFVDNIKVGVIGTLGLAFLFYTVISLMNKIERAFNHTWHVGQQRSFAKRFSDYFSVILLGPVLVFTALGLTAAVFNSGLMSDLRQIEPFGSLIGVMTRISPYLMIVLAFMLIYIFIPNTKVRIRNALAGAIIAGVLWQTLGLGFAFFLANSPRMTAIYSAFASLVVFMIWLYLSWMILLMGSSFAFYTQYPEYRRARRGRFELSSKAKEKIALLLMRKIGTSFYRGETAPTIHALSNDLKVPMDAVEDVLEGLEKGGMVTRTEGDNIRYLPARPLDSIKLARLVDVVRSAGEHGAASLQLLPPDKEVEKIVDRLESAAAAELGENTLRQLVESEEQTAPEKIKKGFFRRLRGA